MEQEMTLDLREIFEIIKKRIWIILVITFITTGVSGVISFFVIDPTYQADTSIIIGKAPDGSDDKIQYNDVMMYQKLAKTYGEIAKSRLVAEKTISRLGQAITTEELMKKVTVSPQADTQIMVISAKDKSPQAAADTVNALAETFIDEAMRIYPTGNVQIMDSAPVPDRPVSPNKKLNVAIAFFLGIMVSLGIIFIIEYMDNTIKTQEDIEKHLELPVIGIIPRNQEQ